MKRDPIRPMEVAWLESEAEEHARRKLTHERCCLMEAALRAVGFAPGTVYWNVALLCARLASSWQPIERELSRLACDSAIGCSSDSVENRKRSLRRALDELAAWGLLTWSTRTGEARRRTRPESLISIELDPAKLRAAADGFEIRTDPGQRGGQIPDNGTDNEADRPRTTAGQNQNHSLYVSLSPIPSLPSSPSLEDAVQPIARKSIELTTTARSFDLVSDPELDQALDAAGVECKRLVCREAQTHRVSRSDLLDACFVIRYTEKLTGGSLVAWIRNGGWPVSGVPTADQIRDRRHQAAERIRESVLRDANSRSLRPPEELIRQVMEKRLREAGLEDQVQSLVGFAKV